MKKGVSKLINVLKSKRNAPIKYSSNIKKEYF